MSFNFTVIKKNQLLAGAVTMMLVTAGYLNYKYDPTKTYDVEVTSLMNENLGDAVLVDATGVIQNPLASGNVVEHNYIDSNDGIVPVFQNNTELAELMGEKEIEQDKGVIKSEKVFNEIEDYFISTRIERTNQYAEQIENYETILLGENTSETQKNRAQEEIEKINKIRNSIMISENLILLKGFDEVVILVNENSINVVVDSENLSSTEVAQIQSVIVNEFSIDIENVHIISYEK